MKIGILGGSFDPIHNGHLHMAMQAQREYGLDEVWLVPAGHSPNKDESAMTPGSKRVQMCQLAVRDLQGIAVCTLEVDSPERSYTYRTMEKLTERYPEYEFYFIMGGDSLDYFEQWVHPEIISALGIILVVCRENWMEEELIKKARYIRQLFPADIRMVHCEKLDISSRTIRAAFAIGKEVAVKEFLPESVYAYIQEHKLYTA